MKISKPSKWEKRLAIVVGISLGIVLSTSAEANLDQAIAYAEAGEVRKAEIELYNISQRAMDGNPKAMCEFGTMYMREGLWIVQSEEDAFEWWHKSAMLGYAPCQFALGASFLIGNGIEKDLSKAKYWLGKAKDSTYTKYANASEELYKIHELDNY